MPKIEVTFKIVEKVVTEVSTTLTVDSEEEMLRVMSDRDALRFDLADAKDEWIDKIDPAAGAIVERDILEILSVTGNTKED